METSGKRRGKPMTSESELREVVARQLARAESVGAGQGAEHLDVKGYRSRQEKNAWPERSEDYEWVRDDDHGIVHGTDHFYAHADDLILALSAAGYEVRHSPPIKASVSEADGKPLAFGYTNHRGEYSVRITYPRRMWWGETKWHREEQWLVTAWDVGRNAERDFAFKDIVPVYLHPPASGSVSDEAVEAGRAAFRKAWNSATSSEVCRPEWMRAALTAALPFLHPAEGAAEVKPLEWSDSAANSILGVYRILDDTDFLSDAKFDVWLQSSFSDEAEGAYVVGGFGNWKEASDAAQADFEARIKSALVAK